MLKFITNRPLWVSIVAGVLLAVCIFSIFILSLNLLTHHGSSRTVPAVIGKTYDEAKAQLEKMGFDVEIQDSIYIDTMPPLSVLKQFPEGDATVKVNRKVYLTINRSVPPIVEMPNLIGYSFRSAEMVLKNMGLRIGDTIYRPDFARNSVLRQMSNEINIEPGTKLQMGSSITLVLGTGVGESEFAVPDIIGMTYEEARSFIESSGLSFLSVRADPDVKDSANAYIYWQNPKRFDEEGKIHRIRSGQTMDIMLGINKPAVADSINH